MRRVLCLLLAVSIIAYCFTACGCEHEWTAATCTAPATCNLCGKTDGDPIEHTWLDANCSAPATCSVCGTTTGEIGDHVWADATCTEPKKCMMCELAEGEALGHTPDEYWSEDGSADPVKGTIASSLHCINCFEVIETKEEPAWLVDVEGNQKFIFTPNQLAERINYLADANALDYEAKLEIIEDQMALVIYDTEGAPALFAILYENETDPLYADSADANEVDTIIATHNTFDYATIMDLSSLIMMATTGGNYSTAYSTADSMLQSFLGGYGSDDWTHYMVEDKNSNFVSFRFLTFESTSGAELVSFAAKVDIP